MLSEPNARIVIRSALLITIVSEFVYDKISPSDVRAAIITSHHSILSGTRPLIIVIDLSVLLAVLLLHSVTGLNL